MKDSPLYTAQRSVIVRLLIEKKNQKSREATY